MNSVNISENYLIFTLNEMEFKQNSIISFVGRCGKLKIDRRNINIRKTYISNFKFYLQYLEEQFGENFAELLLITSTEILLISTAGFKIIQQLHQFSSPPYFNEVVANIRLQYSDNTRGQQSQRKINEDQYHNISRILDIQYHAYGTEIDLVLIEEIMVLLNKKEETLNDYLNVKRKTSHSIIKHLIDQIIKERFGKHPDLTIEFDNLMNLIQSMDNRQFEGYLSLVDFINQNSSLRLNNISEQANLLLIRYMVEENSQFQYGDKYLFKLFLQLFVLETQLSTISEDFLNFINSFIFILDSREKSSYFQFILYTLGLLLYIRYVKQQNHFSQSINYEQFISFYQNYFMTFTSINRKEAIIERKNINNIEAKVDRILTDLLSSNNSWENFLLKDIQSYDRYSEFCYSYLLNNKRSYKDIDQFIAEILRYFEFDGEEGFVDLFVVHVIQFFIDLCMHETKLNPSKIIETGSIIKFVDEKLQDIDSDLLEKYEDHYRSIDSFKIQQKFHSIIFGEGSNSEKLELLCHFFDVKAINDEKEILNYQIKQFRALRWVIDNIDILNSDKIHQLLDILDLRSSKAFSRTTAINQLIRNYLNNNPMDKLTRYYLEKYFDEEKDDTHVSKELLDQITNEISNQDNVEVDIYDLKLEMEMEMIEEEQEDPDEDNSIPELPLELIDIFPDDEYLPEYFILYHTYYYIQNQLILTKLDDELTELINYLLDYHPYIDKFTPYFPDITNLRHEYTDLVDNIRMELLEIELVARLFPEEGLSRLVNFYQGINQLNYSPTLTDYQKIIQLFQHLTKIAGDHILLDEIMVLSHQIEFYQKNLLNFYHIKDVMKIYQKITISDYQTLDTNTDIEPLIFFIITKEMGDSRIRDFDRTTDLVRILEITDNKWQNPEKLEHLLEEWLQFPEEIIQIIDRIALRFDIKGWTATRLHLIEHHILPIQNLVDILQEELEVEYLQYAYQLVIQYLIGGDRTDLAEMVLDKVLSELPEDGDLKNHHKRILEFVKFAKYIKYTGWIQIVEVMYDKYATEKQIKELNQMLINKVRIDTKPMRDNMIQSIIEFFEETPKNNPLDEFFDDM